MANPLLGVALKGQRNEASRLRDGVVPNTLPGVHGCWDHDEGEIRQHALALGSKDKVDKGLQHSGLLSRKGTPVLQVCDSGNCTSTGADRFQVSDDKNDNDMIALKCTQYDECCPNMYSNYTRKRPQTVWGSGRNVDDDVGENDDDDGGGGDDDDDGS